MLMAKTNHIDSTRPAPISTNESTTYTDWNSYTNSKSFRNSKYGNLRNKTETLVLLK